MTYELTRPTPARPNKRKARTTHQSPRVPHQARGLHTQGAAVRGLIRAAGTSGGGGLALAGGTGRTPKAEGWGRGMCLPGEDGWSLLEAGQAVGSFGSKEARRSIRGSEVRTVGD